MNTNKKLQQLLLLCLKKNINFNLSPAIYHISCFSFTSLTSKYVRVGESYYKGNLKDYTDSYAITLDDLIEKVKNF